MSSPNKTRGRKTRIILSISTLVLLVLLVFVMFFGVKRSVGTHPHFGPVYEAVAYDLHEANSNRFGVFLRERLPLRIVESKFFPERLKYRPRYLDLHGAKLEWSKAGASSGYVYYYEYVYGVKGRTGPILSTNMWEFAPSNESSFARVDDLPAEFYGGSDPRKLEVFGPKSSGNAVNVSVGQILYARRLDATNRAFILEFKGQRTNELVVHYCIAEASRTSRRTE